MSSLPTLLNLVVTTLQTYPHCTSVAIVETKEFSEEQFFLKVRASLSGGMSFQVRVYYNRGHHDYAYQLFADAPIWRWDNKEDCPGLENFPHHQHRPRGGIVSSTLCGDPAIDLPEVLKAIGKFLESNSTPI